MKSTENSEKGKKQRAGQLFRAINSEAEGGGGGKRGWKEGVRGLIRTDFQGPQQPSEDRRKLCRPSLSRGFPSNVRQTPPEAWPVPPSNQ